VSNQTLIELSPHDSRTFTYFVVKSGQTLSGEGGKLHVSLFPQRVGKKGGCIVPQKYVLSSYKPFFILILTSSSAG
jgi:hypothetical protein